MLINGGVKIEGKGTPAAAAAAGGGAMGSSIDTRRKKVLCGDKGRRIPFETFIQEENKNCHENICVILRNPRKTIVFTEKVAELLDNKIGQNEKI